jgi:DNA-binding IclR family transcriptional regulator
MLAEMSREQLLALYPDDAAFAQRGDAVMTRRHLRDVLRETRGRGFATESGDITAGLGSVAVAIVDRVGWPIAALALTFDDTRAITAELLATIRATAAEISKRLRV